METFALAGVISLGLFFYTIIFWLVPLIGTVILRRNSMKKYFGFVAIMHLIMGLVIWGAWGVVILERL